MLELSPRQRTILNLVIQEYIVTASPVGSEAIVRRRALGISPATVRNEMVELERGGYLYQPHTSAGRVPSNKGYRFFVEILLQASELPPDEQRTISHQFHQVELELDQWTQLAASILARTVRTTAMVTAPSRPTCCLKHLELVSVQDALTLLVVVLQEGHLRQQMLSLPEAMEQDNLSKAAHRLTAHFKGLSATEVMGKALDLSAAETHVRDALVRIMRQVDASSHNEMVYDGLADMLRQPEFSGSERIREILEALERRAILAVLLPKLGSYQDVQVIIGEENTWPPLQECAVVLARYGIVGEAGGMLGVLGPTRLAYGRAIPAVRYLSRIMTDLLREVYA
ncbi:MAG: heat-inducible transcription repressor HrcA [Chloroflexi bacterium]|nr:heat-inducible transcription repressor HrcA [Chloroflexota bacterium]